MSAQFRKGDIVTIEATIESKLFHMDDGKAQVKIKFPPYHDAYVDPALLTMLRPAFEVGDTVEFVAAGRFGKLILGEVKAIDGESLWVKRHGGGLDTWEMNRVHRADPRDRDTPDDPQAADPDPVEPPPAPLDGKVGSEEEA